MRPLSQCRASWPAQHVMGCTMNKSMALFVLLRQLSIVPTQCYNSNPKQSCGRTGCKKWSLSTGQCAVPSGNSSALPVAAQAFFSWTSSAAGSGRWCLSSQAFLLYLRAALKGAKVTRAVSNDLQGIMTSGCRVPVTEQVYREETDRISDSLVNSASEHSSEPAFIQEPTGGQWY